MKPLIFALSFLLLSSSAFAQDSSWELKKEAKGVKVYTKTVEGSILKEFRGVAILPASLDKVRKVFEDTESGCSWIYKCKEFKEIKVVSPAEKYFYYRQGLSWPVLDRDVVDLRIRTQDPKTKMLSYHISEASPEMYPYQKSVVRMPYLRVLWQFTPKSETTVELDYQIQADPGGKIPKWLVNRLSTDIPIDTLSQFTEALKKSKP